MTIEYSTITRNYYVLIPGQPRSLIVGIPRKDDAERLAKLNGATEIKHVTLRASTQLEQMGFDHASAVETARKFYADGRR